MAIEEMSRNSCKHKLIICANGRWRGRYCSYLEDVVGPGRGRLAVDEAEDAEELVDDFAGDEAAHLRLDVLDEGHRKQGQPEERKITFRERVPPTSH